MTPKTLKDMTNLRRLLAFMGERAAEYSDSALNQCDWISIQVGPQLLLDALNEFKDAPDDHSRCGMPERDMAAVQNVAVKQSSRAPEPGTWQPIESAPKDGTVVLLWWRATDGVAYWAAGAWQEFGDGSKGWIGESFHASEDGYWTRIVGDRPTHWMPLPVAPPSAPPRADQ